MKVSEKKWFLPLLLLFAGLVLGVILSAQAPWLFRGAGQAPLGVQSIPGVSTEVRSLQASLSAVAQQVVPAVVNISTVRVYRTRPETPSPFFNDPLFKEFFGEDFYRFFGVPREQVERSLGSGVLVTEDGYIITNNHVIAQSSQITVSLADKREFKATVVGTDPKIDVAVLKINGAHFPIVSWGDSDRTGVGDIVLAIGNPFGIGETVTMGIISAKGRSQRGIADYEDFIQTDAAINPGNSGGALVNIDGALIGINTAIFSNTGGYQGIGFAIPANKAKTVTERFVQRDKRIGR